MGNNSVVIPVLRRTELNGSFLGNGASQTFRLPTINVLPFYYAQLVVRVHEATWSTGAYFRVEGFASYPTSEDKREFLGPSARLTAAALQSVVTTPYGVAASDSDLPLAYQFRATLRMSNTAASLSVVVSADLHLRALDSDCACTQGRRSRRGGRSFAPPPQKPAGYDEEAVQECKEGCYESLENCFNDPYTDPIWCQLGMFNCWNLCDHPHGGGGIDLDLESLPNQILWPEPDNGW